MTTKTSRSSNGRTHTCCGKRMRVDRKRAGDYVSTPYVAHCRVCRSFYDCADPVHKAPPHILSKKPVRIQAETFEPLPKHWRFIG